MHVTILSPGTVATSLPYLSFVDAVSTVRLVPTNSGQHIFGFHLIVPIPYIAMPMSLVWSNKTASRRLLVLPGDFLYT